MPRVDIKAATLRLLLSAVTKRATTAAARACAVQVKSHTQQF